MSMRDRIAKTNGEREQSPASPFRRPTGRATYPKRKVIDLTEDQFNWLNDRAYEARVSATGIVRTALDWLRDHPDELDEVIDATHDIERGAR